MTTTSPPGEADIADLRTTLYGLYGLYAILRLQTAQEDEAYLSLGDEGNRAGRQVTSGALVLHAVVTFSS